jgi:hypothetical protein
MSKAIAGLVCAIHRLSVVMLLVAGTSAAAATASATPKEPGTQSCLMLSQIDSSNVMDDKTIIFRMRSGTPRYYKNTLPYRCSGLGFNEAFSYKTSINQLCSVDIIHVLENVGGVREGMSCGLGDFVPYTPPEKIKK